MAKKSMIVRARKRWAATKKQAATRAALVEITKDPAASPEERQAACLALSKLPRPACAPRLRNRCHTTGRPRCHLRAFEPSRSAMRGRDPKEELSGVKKSRG